MALLNDLCAICNQAALSELYPATLDNKNVVVDEVLDINDYKCTSMSHHIKPMISRCENCKMVQIPRSRQPADLVKAYGEVVDEDYLNNFQVKRKTFSYAYKNIKKYIARNARILEIGSYCGLFLAEAQRNGLRCTGIEPSRWAANYSQAHLPDCEIINLPVEEAVKVINGQFDVVASWDVIEHVQDPMTMLKSIHSLLKNDGYFIFSTITIDSFIAKLMGKKWHWIMDMHLYYFSQDSLEYLLKESRFELVEEGGHRHYASIKYAYSKLCFCFPKKIANLMIKIEFLVPDIVLPFTLGDVRYFVLKKCN